MHMSHSPVAVGVRAVITPGAIKPFIRYGSNTCWIHTITIKEYKYK